MHGALELFQQRGYDWATAAAIAERAGVTEMTFFRYFPSKDSVLIADPYDPFFAEAITRQPAELSPLAAATIGALSAALLECADGEDPDLGNAIHVALHVLSGDRR